MKKKLCLKSKVHIYSTQLKLLVHGRVCERMSYEEFKNVIYICRYLPKNKDFTAKSYNFSANFSLDL